MIRSILYCAIYFQVFSALFIRKCMDICNYVYMGCCANWYQTLKNSVVIVGQNAILTS